MAILEREIVNLSSKGYDREKVAKLISESNHNVDLKYCRQRVDLALTRESFRLAGKEIPSSLEW